MAAPGTTGSHETKSSVIRSFLAQPRDVISDPSDQVTKVMMFLLYAYIKSTTANSILTISSRNGKIDTV